MEARPGTATSAGGRGRLRASTPGACSIPPSRALAVATRLPLPPLPPPTPQAPPPPPATARNPGRRYGQGSSQAGSHPNATEPPVVASSRPSTSVQIQFRSRRAGAVSPLLISASRPFSFFSGEALADRPKGSKRSKGTGCGTTFLSDGSAAGGEVRGRVRGLQGVRGWVSLGRRVCRGCRQRP